MLFSSRSSPVPEILGLVWPVPTSSAHRLPNFTTIVLLIQTEDLASCQHSVVNPTWRCVDEVMKVSFFSKGLRGFRIEREFDQGNFLCWVESPWNVTESLLFIRVIFVLINLYWSRVPLGLYFPRHSVIQTLIKPFWSAHRARPLLLDLGHWT